MKKIYLAVSLCLIALTAFTQKEEKNGTIYIKHPYIDVVNKSAKAYLDRDIATNTALFADTAKFWYSGLEKPMPIAEALKMWDGDFAYYDSIKIKVVGYPDYLAYTDKDTKVVQSWEPGGKSKKTGATQSCFCSIRHF
jgi:hypothetical protein